MEILTANVPVLFTNKLDTGSEGTCASCGTDNSIVNDFNFKLITSSNPLPKNAQIVVNFGYRTDVCPDKSSITIGADGFNPTIECDTKTITLTDAFSDFSHESSDEILIAML